MKELLKLSPLPTAVFAANDLMALGAMIAIREAGLRIPDDIALIGLDDIPAAKLVYPPLTTSSQMQEDIGRRAAEMLFERINGTVPAEPRMVEMPFKLIVRESA
jgi:LacI family transcriptional regulator